MEDSFVHPSVAELAGKFKGNALPTAAATQPSKPVRRRPPSSLKIPGKTDGEQTGDEKAAPAPAQPPKVKLKNSPIFEKLQATLSPTALLPSPKSPGMKLPLSPTSPGSSFSVFSPTSLPQHQRPSEEEVPASFEKPAEGSKLPSFNKGRARGSLKRRPPSRKHIKSVGDESEVVDNGTGSSVQNSHVQNGKEEEVFADTSQETKAEHGHESPSALPDTRPGGEEKCALSEEVQAKTEMPDSGKTDGTESPEVAEETTEDKKPEDEVIAELVAAERCPETAEELRPGDTTDVSTTARGQGVPQNKESDIDKDIEEDNKEEKEQKEEQEEVKEEEKKEEKKEQEEEKEEQKEKHEDTKSVGN